jgi:hypothetical protein
MQRVSKDLWDAWVDEDPGFSSLKLQFDVAKMWQGRALPGYWPDLDMLPIGRLSLRGPRGPRRESELTRDEQISMLTLWAMFGSPLMIGGELSSMPDEALRLLTNPELLRVQQTGLSGRELWRRGDHIAWRKELPQQGAVALSLFNLGERPERVALTRADAPELERAEVLDAWQNEPCSAAGAQIEALVPAHGARLFLVHSPGARTP